MYYEKGGLFMCMHMNVSKEDIDHKQSCSNLGSLFPIPEKSLLATNVMLLCLIIIQLTCHKCVNLAYP